MTITTAHRVEQRDIDLSSAARLEAGLQALDDGNVPAALGALSAIPEDDWSTLVRRFPALPSWIEQVMNP
jgi:hypothetical protein